jgi:predicted transcriptional regulator
MSWFVEMCKEMEAQHGERGWKRKLAIMLGVSDSNVQNWIRAGDAPPIVRTAYEAKEEIRDLQEDLATRELDRYVIEELDHGFRILVLDEETGRFIEQATAKNIGLARAIVQFISGGLEQKISSVFDSLYDYVDGHPDDQRSLRDLSNWNEPTRREKLADMARQMNDLLTAKSKEGSSDGE